MRHKPFLLDKSTFDLEHLRSVIVEFVQPAKQGLKENTYKARVVYSTHCYTRGVPDDGCFDSRLLLKNGKESRLFDMRRYRLSMLLPEIIKQLPSKRCFHTGKGNFFIAQIINDEGKAEDYEIYFQVRRLSNDQVDLEIVVESAYVRDQKHLGKPRKKPINFFVIMYNRKSNRPIVVPP